MKNLRDSRDFGNPAHATLGHREFTPLHGFGTPPLSGGEPWPRQTTECLRVAL